MSKKGIGRIETVTCAYCGAEFPAGTTPGVAGTFGGSPALDAHIRKCKHHPLYEALQEIAKLEGVVHDRDAYIVELLDEINAGEQP